jgi:hypothetical protein
MAPANVWKLFVATELSYCGRYAHQCMLQELSHYMTYDATYEKMAIKFAHDAILHMTASVSSDKR